MARTPEHREDYNSPTALIRGERCNYGRARKRWRMLDRECGGITPIRLRRRDGRDAPLTRSEW